LLEVPTGQVSRSEGDIHVLGNPHYWMSPENARIIAANIAEKLSALEPQSAAMFQANLKRFTDELDAKMAAWRQSMASHRGKTVAAYHNQWVYFTEFLGLKGGIFLEPKPGIPPSPGHLLSVVERMKQENVAAIVQSSYDPVDAARTVADRSGAKVAVLASNVSEIPEARTYIDMIDHGVRSLTETLANG
jgi:zinc/manganese transport system substrate-binding protein